MSLCTGCLAVTGLSVTSTEYVDVTAVPSFTQVVDGDCQCMIKTVGECPACDVCKDCDAQVSWDVTACLTPTGLLLGRALNVYFADNVDCSVEVTGSHFITYLDATSTCFEVTSHSTYVDTCGDCKHSLVVVRDPLDLTEKLRVEWFATCSDCSDNGCDGACVSHGCCNGGDGG